MKQILSAIIAITSILFYGCSTDNNGTTTVIPLAPTNLTATVISTTQVDLHWTDNSTNESGYKVQRKTGGGNFADVASTGVDITSHSDMNLTPNTTYTYRVYAYNSAGNSIQYSNEVTVTTNLIPIITTSPISDTTAVSATCGGNITSDAGSAVTARGVCWSTTSGPTVALSTKTTDGTGTGSFASSITGLNTNTTYYVRAYATNANGTSYGNEVSFTSFNVANLPSVTICNQIWTTKNLDVATYRNGDPIPQVTDPTQWANLTTGAWCYCNNDAANGPIYGKLYNWYAVNDLRGLAPLGWHLPSDVEWTLLETCLSGSSVAGGPMKEAGLTHWLSPNAGATNSSGFAGIPGGLRDYNGTFGNIGAFGGWWSSTENNASGSWGRGLYYGSGDVGRLDNSKSIGFSVRCLRD